MHSVCRWASNFRSTNNTKQGYSVTVMSHVLVLEAAILPGDILFLAYYTGMVFYLLNGERNIPNAA